MRPAAAAKPVFRISVFHEPSSSGRTEPNGDHSWQHWEIDWEANNLGRSLLRSRAADSKGNVQPMLAPWNFRCYQVNSIHSVPITVRKPWSPVITRRR